MHSTNATFQSWCDRAIARLLKSHPADAARLSDFQQLIHSGADLRSRQTLPGHVTASALLLTHDRQSILLIHNRKLGRWLQPGGHVDPGEFPLEAAHREVAEEVGLNELTPLPAFEDDPSLPLDVDSHTIPANPKKSESPHTHHDFRYAMIVPAGRSAVLRPQASEISGAEWVAVNELLPESLKRALVRLA